MAIFHTESKEEKRWRMYFDGAPNALGHGIGVVLISPNGDQYSATVRLDFDCTNNMEKYDACILRIQMAIEKEMS